MFERCTLQRVRVRPIGRLIFKRLAEINSSDTYTHTRDLQRMLCHSPPATLEARPHGGPVVVTLAGLRLLSRLAALNAAFIYCGAPTPANFLPSTSRCPSQSTAVNPTPVTISPYLNPCMRQKGNYRVLRSAEGTFGIARIAHRQALNPEPYSTPTAAERIEVREQAIGGKKWCKHIRLTLLSFDRRPTFSNGTRQRSLDWLGP